MSHPNKRLSLQSERSFDSSTGRPTKYFKLDRTYSDVVEDELYDPQTEDPPVVPSNSARKSPQFRTERIQNAYPQLFDKPVTQAPLLSYQRSDQYWPGMESGIRFDRDQRPDSRVDSPVIADKKQKLQQQVEQSTVSPKEAFLDYSENQSDNPEAENKASVFDRTSSRGFDDIPTSKRRTSHIPTSDASKISQYPQITPQAGLGEITVPKTITPVRANEKLSPKPVARGSIVKAGSLLPPSGPTKAQAVDNAAANAKIRALYKEESTTSNLSGGSELHSPPSVADSDGDYLSSGTTNVTQAAALNKTYECEECHESFDRAFNLELHVRIHARPPAPIASSQTLHDDEESDEDDGDHDSGDRLKNKGGGPHRCDWIVPSTGQVCGTIFSRPYDLVRHQDTIHRAKKLEFRCEICIAAGTNKIFSRNDALVRHMRHVHKKDLPRKP